MRASGTASRNSFFRFRPSCLIPTHEGIAKVFSKPAAHTSLFEFFQILTLYLIITAARSVTGGVLSIAEKKKKNIRLPLFRERIDFFSSERASCGKFPRPTQNFRSDDTPRASSISLQSHARMLTPRFGNL